MIYSYILVNEHPVVALYQHRSSPSSTHAQILSHSQAVGGRVETLLEQRVREQQSLISDLRNISWVHKELRREARNLSSPITASMSPATWLPVTAMS